MAARLRGDDTLHSLIEELSSKQGYEESPENNNSQKIRENHQVGIARVRLTAKVDGYQSSSGAEENPTLAGSQAIWNPRIRSSHQERSVVIRFPPTNPHVEVFRRRAYEKFKSDFRAVFERVRANNNNNTESKRRPNNMWGDLAIPSLLERWHFDTKLEEYLELRKCTDRCSIVNPITNDGNCSVSWIRNVTLGGREGGDVPLMDPVLVSASPHRTVHDTAKSRDKRKVRSPATTLTDELQFEWIRTWRRVSGSGGGISNLDVVFASKAYRKKVSKINVNVRNLILEAETSLLNEIARRAALEDKLSSTHKQSNKSLPKVTIEIDDQVHVTFSGLSFRLHESHYHKLQVLFDRVHPSSIDEASHRASFVSSLFCLLARYDMLQGAGLQASMHGAAFDMLLKRFDCRMECFASPLNCRYERYCSAFPDTDAAFGSVGSFFDFNFQVGGCYQANPPFTTNFIQSMYETMHHALEECNDNALMFVVFLPAWDDTDGWKALRESPHLTRHETISQTSHYYYCEGTQHRRKERYRIASFDTTIFFLQNARAREMWPIVDEHVDELRTAFARNPQDENVEAREVVTSTKRSSGRETIPAPKRARCETEMARSNNPSTAAAALKPISRKKKDKKQRKRQKPLEDGKEDEQQTSILISLGLL